MTSPFDRLIELLQEEATGLQVRADWHRDQHKPQEAAADALAAAAATGLALALNAAVERWLEELDGAAEDILGPGDDPA